jgi:ABC-type nickel/cobalt efflux system permease component RcnA
MARDARSRKSGNLMQSPLHSCLSSRRPIFLLLACLLIFTPVAIAHPMGNFSVNHYSKINLQPDRITVQYIIDLAEIPTYQEMQQGGIQADAKDEAVSHYVANRGRELGLGLNLTLNGEPLPLHMISSSVLFPPGAGGLPTMKMGFVYEAFYPARIDRTHVQLHYADNNYSGHTGWKEIIALAPGATLLSSSVPATDRSDQLNNYPTDLLNSPPQALEASLIATLPAISSPMSNRAIVAAKVPKPSPAPTSRTSAPAIISTNSAPHVITAESLSPSTPKETPPMTLKANRQQTPRSKFTELISAPHLSPWFLLTAAFIAIGLGGLHALEPGHGKTIVAAYLVGSRGTAVHAILLGLIVTISHTAGVFALGAITLYASRYIVPEQLYPWLGLFSGFTIAALGCYMALRRLTGTASDHSHLPGESHSHWSFFKRAQSEDQAKNPPIPQSNAKPVSLSQLLVLGITGGIVPCPAALIVLLSAITLHRIGLGFFLIVAFSVGLAAVLISFGMLMVFARRFMSRMAMEGPLTRKWLPLASSAFITVLGIALVTQAVSSMNLHPAVFSHAIFSQTKIGGLLFVTGLGLILGMRHSTDADHVVAISTIVTRQKSIRGAAIIGSVWGIGHTITIFVVGSLIILFKVEIPPRAGLSMEFCVALMLVFLGVLNLSGAMQKITRFFTLAKGAQVTPPPLPQPIASRGSLTLRGTAFSQLGVFQCARPLVIGLVHGLAGSAAVALLVLSTIHDPLWATLYLLIFGAGTMLGMMCMTAAMAASLNFAGQRFSTLSRHLGTLSGMVSLCFGSFLVFQLGIMGGLFTSHPVWIPR